MDSRHASLVIAFSGLTAKQRDLLSLRAHFEGTYYIDQGLRPWWPQVGIDKWGREVAFSCSEREPGIQLGILPDKASKLLDRIVGEGKLPAFKNAPDSIVKILFDEDQFDLVDAIQAPALDLVVLGALCLGTSRVGTGAKRRWESLYIDPIFARPIFAAQAGSKLAEAYAEELDDLRIPRQKPAKGHHLFVPPGARSSDLIALCYEPAWLVEEANEVWRSRRDFLPNVTVSWAAMKVVAGQIEAPRWDLEEEIAPHDWGMVPLVWQRMTGGDPNDPFGPSFYTRALQSISVAADYTESMRQDAVRAIAWPQRVEIDVESLDYADAGEDFGLGQMPRGMDNARSSGSGTVERYRSTGDGKGSGRVDTLEPEGTGLDQAQKQIEDFQSHADRLSGVLEHDQEKAAGALSGVALEKMLEPTIARVKAYRRPLSKLLRQLIVKLGILTLNAGSAKVECLWPRVVSPTPEDLAKLAEALTKANGGRIVMSHKTSVLMFANMAEIPDPEAEWTAVEAEAKAIEDRLFAEQESKNGGGDTDPDADPEDEPDDEPDEE